MGTQCEQLERKAHQVRARLTETLEELRAGMTPGQVVDQLAEYACELIKERTNRLNDIDNSEQLAPL